MKKPTKITTTYNKGKLVSVKKEKIEALTINQLKEKLKKIKSSTVNLSAEQSKKLGAKLGRIVKTYTVNTETANFISNEFPNIKDGRAIDEVVRLYKEFKGKPTNTHL